LRAIQNVRLICDKQLLGRHELEVIDIYQHVGQLAGEVVVAPTLVRQSPLPCAGWSGICPTAVKCWRGWTSFPRWHRTSLGAAETRNCSAGWRRPKRIWGLCKPATRRLLPPPTAHRVFFLKGSD
jgi:hypothetical protein